MTAAIMDALREAMREEIAAEVAAEVKRQLSTSTAAQSAPAVAGAPEREWVDEVTLAEWLDISRETVQQWRANGDGPAYTRVAKRSVRYHVPTVRTWLAGRTR